MRDHAAYSAWINARLITPILGGAINHAFVVWRLKSVFDECDDQKIAYDRGRSTCSKRGDDRREVRCARIQG